MKDNFIEKQEEESLSAYFQRCKDELADEREIIRKRLFFVGACYGAGFILLASYNWRIAAGLGLIILAHEIHNFIE